MPTSLLRASSRRKSNRALAGTGSQTEETAHRIKPPGSPGSLKFFLDVILISSPLFVGILVQVWKLDAPTALQKEQVIRCASFKVLFLPASVDTPTETETRSSQPPEGASVVEETVRSVQRGTGRVLRGHVSGHGEHQPLAL